MMPDSTKYSVLGTQYAICRRRDDTHPLPPLRGEPHTALQAVVRGLTHAAYHVGQILYVARLVNPAAPWLTIAPGASGVHRPGYLKNGLGRTSPE